MKCIKCGYSRFNECDEEIICEHCGASYCLEYLGYYPEGSDERIDEGYESEQYKDLLKSLRDMKK